MSIQHWYGKLDSLKLSEAKLRSNHYPRLHPNIPGKAQVFNIETSFYRIIPGPSLRTCKRCFKQYHIKTNGMPSVEEQCFYHPYRLSLGRYATYRCCQRGRIAAPCKTSPHHIHEDIDPENLYGFITTRNNSVLNSPNIFALDCEMVCTTVGMELAAICIVDHSCNVVYQTLVRPENTIIDYLTEFSNLTETDFRSVTTRMADVHRKCLTMFDDKTILVGHGMNNDLLWLKLIHDRIVDTAVLYPHNKGPGFQTSLRYLKEKFLGCSGGSNNIPKYQEDAIDAMKLALIKCRQQ